MPIIEVIRKTLELIDLTTLNQVAFADSESGKFESYEVTTLNYVIKQLEQGLFNEFDQEDFIVKEMENPYAILLSGYYFNENFISSLFLKVTKGSENVFVKLSVEICEGDCESSIDDFNFIVYEENEWQDLSRRYLSFLTKDQLTMLFTTALSSLHELNHLPK